MGRRWACVAGTLVVVICASCRHVQDRRPPLPMPTSELPLEVTTAAQAREIYAARLSAALPALTGDDLGARRQAEQSLQASCWLAARPGAECERRGIGTALAEALAGDLPTPAQLFLLRELAMVGRDEAVPALSARLTHADRQVRDAACRALAANPAPEAGEALRARLAVTTEVGEQVALLQALLYRGDDQDVALFRHAAQSSQEALCRLGFDGLARLGTPADAAVLRAALDHGPERLRPAAADACLRLAESLCARGQTLSALGLFKDLLAVRGPARYAAIIGLGRAGGAAELPLLIGLLGEDEAQARGAARAALVLLPAGDVVPALAAALESAPPQTRSTLLQALAESRVPAVRPALTAALAEDDDALRLIAIDGLGALADPLAAPALAEVVATATGPTLAAARNALALIPGEAVASALMDAFPKASADGRRALLATLSTRRGRPTVAFLRECAAADPDPAVREEALRGLSRLAAAADVPDLLELLLAAPTESECSAATQALAAAARRTSGQSGAAVEPVLAALAQARPVGRARLLRAAGRLGGEGALAAVRRGLADPDPALRDAAVRALADWPDASALDDLLGLVRAAPETVHRVLALRGFVRIVREVGALSPAEQLARLTAAMAVVPRPEDRRLVLAGLGDVADPGALPVALACLEAPETADEAVAAVTAIVGELRWQQPHECMAALAQLAAKAPAAADRAAAASLAADLRRYADHIRVWLLAGPYTKDGAKRQALHDIPFPPEPDAPAAAVNWLGVRTGATPESSWYVPLDELLKGDQRVAYLRTWFRVPAARMARLELATDDACKAWFNGALVADRNVDRALAPAQDTPGVELRPGWNCLLLKVTQGSGNWSAAARVCGPGGERLADVVFLDDPRAADLAATDLRVLPVAPATLSAGLDLARADAAPLASLRTLLAALAASDATEVAAEARERLRRLEACEDYLVHWEVAGPYERAGVEGPGLLDVAFAPEQSDAKATTWQPAPVSAGSDRVPMVDLGAVIGGSHRVAYLRARVVAAKAQPVQVELGSDDGVKVWLNGRLVHANNTFRPVRPGEDKAAAELQAGDNVVVMKITQGGGGWGACLRFRSPTGGHLEGVRELVPES